MFAAVGIIMLLLYGLLVWYVGWSGWRWLRMGRQLSRTFKILYIILWLVVSTSFILGRVFDNVLMNVLGAYWMAVFYLSLLVLPVVHLVLLASRWTPLPRQRAEKWAAGVTLAVMLGLIAYGSFNAYSPVVRTYEIEVAKPSAAGDRLRIVMAADMHFGVLSGSGHAARMVEEINRLEPDLVLMPGDLVDDTIVPYVEQGMDALMRNIRAPYGVYASLGNHDRYTGRIDELIEVLERSGIRVLYDETAIIAGDVTLVGRKDRSDRNRADLTELMEGVDLSKPVILLDHQPYELDAAKEAGIDLMVSGHTHRGQVAPFVTKLIYENDWGLLQKESFYSVVTSGYGFWGPPIRLGSRSELVMIEVRFTG